MAVVLVKPEFDVLQPGQHNGTFRGNNIAFVSAAASIEYWACEVGSEREIAKLQASETRIENWIDVAFRNDVFTSVRAEPNVYVGDTRTRQAAEQIYPDTLQPRMPKRSWLAYSEHHGAYYRCDQAMVPVLTLPEALPESLQTKQA